MCSAEAAEATGGEMRRLAYLAFVIIYGICPVDLVPDVVPVLGWTDDVAVGIIGVFLALRRRGK